MKRRILTSMILASCALVVACSDDVEPGDGCAPGESFNPITGQCVTPSTGPDVSLGDAGQNDVQPLPDTGSGVDVSPVPDAGSPPDAGTPPDTGGQPDTGSVEDVFEDVFEDVEADVPVEEPGDPNDPIARNCMASDLAELVEPQIVESVAANYRLAIDPAAALEPVQGLNAHVFEDEALAYTGFVFAGAPPAGQTQPRELVNAVYQALLNDWPEALLEAEGRPKITHDHYRSHVFARIALPAGTTPDAARDTALARLGAASITHALAGTFAADETETIIELQVVGRNASQYVVIAAIATRENIDDDAALTGIRTHDLVSGTALARRSIALARACAAFDVISTNEIDIIISMDGSGSMGDEQATLSDANFLTEFVGKLDEASLDWRVGVTGVNCSSIRNDTGLSQGFRDLWPPSGGFLDPGSCNEPFNIGGGGGNGRLMGGDFTTDVPTIAQRLNQVSTTASEYTLTMGLAAADRAQPRAQAPDKIRPNAALVIVAVTDEEEQLFKDKLGFLPVRSHTTVLTPAQTNELDLFVRPFVQFAQEPHIAATVFGLYGIPGIECPTTADYAAGIDVVVNQTGGNAGSICQPDIRDTFRDIADVAAGLAQGYRLPAVPVATTLTVKHADIPNNQVVPIERSRADGFDFDALLNRVLLTLETPPENGDRLIMPFFRWEASLPACETVADCPADKKSCDDGECS